MIFSGIFARSEEARHCYATWGLSSRIIINYYCMYLLHLGRRLPDQVKTYRHLLFLYWVLGEFTTLDVERALQPDAYKELCTDLLLPRGPGCPSRLCKSVERGVKK